MSIDEKKLAARRDGLLQRSAELRSKLSEDAEALSRQLRIVDAAAAFVRSGRGRAVVWGGLMLLLASGPGRVVKLASRSALMWSFARRVVPLALAYKRGHRRA
jgi:hypothetical protein